MPYIADLHVHSKYSRATSRDMDVENLSKWAKMKGVDMLGTGDFTHPAWLKELKDNLTEKEYGIYTHGNIDYILATEVSNIYFKAGRTRKVHNIIMAPSFKAAEEVNKTLSEYGALDSDGRPILSLECDKMVKALCKIDKDIMIIPAHIWTPHFSLFGSNSGFDKIEECFEDETPLVSALETGLSSDPPMNWRLSALDKYTLVSNSDAHSPSKIGREANVFKDKIGYKELKTILEQKDREKFLYTVEFFPEEGKYHWDGHRSCQARLSPEEAKNVNYRCPHCGKKLTIGVMNRVGHLADRPEGFVSETAPGYRNVIPLIEIIADAMGVGKESVGAGREYHSLIKRLGSEFNILLYMPKEEILEKCPPKIASGIINVREGRVKVIPGYDGAYGTIKVFDEGSIKEDKQLTFF
ncbi:MAG: endonuclease Q family protein [Candidatus Omnitrophica bacterium]|nr:endonuclease Q family protein [Candidatus Omnitrophota bacterium]MBU4488401.1 endonuclease Q family protein [Candidatus Omnitrophota bacterium]MCG2704997.1 endonuclease Q family protein [Candidatus Omnitrophota bacterium]